MDDFERRAVGFRIRALRQNKGMSQSQFAKYLNMKKSMVSLIENGEHTLFLDELISISKLFGISVQEICRDINQSGTKPAPHPRVMSPSLGKVERLIAVELSKLHPGVLDRILGITGELRAARRRANERVVATSKVLDEILEHTGLSQFMEDNH